MIDFSTLFPIFLTFQDLSGLLSLCIILQYLENKKAGVILLQETHSNPEMTKKWGKVWKGQSFWH